MKPTQIILAAIAIIGIVFTLLTMRPETENEYPLNGEILNSDYVPAKIVKTWKD